MGEKKLVDLVVCYGDAFPRKDADGNEILGRRWGTSENVMPSWDWKHSSCSSTGSSFLSSDDWPEEAGDDEENEEEEEGTPTPITKSLISVHLRAHEGDVSDYPYCITPQQITNSRTRWRPRVPGKVERAQGFELEPLRMDLHATVKQAMLLVQMEEEENVLEFHAIASDLIQLKGKEPCNHAVRECVLTRSLLLKNTTEMRINFRLETQPPFSVLLPQSRAGTGSTDRNAEEPQFLLLRAQHGMQVKVGFCSSPSLLSYLSQLEEQLPPGVQLIHTGSGERKLRFQDSLAIEYSNNSMQLVPLCAHLSLPTLYLSETSLDFGTCYVGQTRVKEVFLSNRGGSSSYWTAVIDMHEQTGQFSVTPDSGVLQHNVAPYRQPLQISFTASEQGEAEATIAVQGILGEHTVSLLVQGKGSFDERFVSLLDDG
ncbi:hypothetical protein GJAV_G00070100 [Gymnothorax javanicus]|nr:hypothetical protein GJAV_G00070100 [Gymnothorax javanicus]